MGKMSETALYGDNLPLESETQEFSLSVDELKKRKMWVLWRRVERDGKSTKMPINAYTGLGAKSNDPATWCTYEQADQAVQKHNCDGVGVMFSQLGDGYVLAGVDIDVHDKRLDSNPLAEEILDLFKDTYHEESPSGKGYHIVFAVRSEEFLPWNDEHYKKNPKKDIECYVAGATNRYFTFTGKKGWGRITDQTETLHIFLHNYMVKDTEERGKPLQAPQMPAQQTLPAPSDDIDTMLDVARKAGNGAKFIRLYDEGNCEGYNSRSEADLALCGMLAFYLQGDYQKIDVAFRKSALYRAEKWERTDYSRETINTAIAGRKGEFYTSSAPQKKWKQPTTAPNGQNKQKKPPLDLNSFRAWVNSKYQLSFDAVKHETDFGSNKTNCHEIFLAVNFPTYLESELQNDFDGGVTISRIERFLNVVVGENVKNPLLDSIKAVKWDGVNRLQQVFDILHIEDRLSKIFLYKWFLQAIAMLHNGDNGIKFAPEFVLVLQGKQGTGKTRFFQHICPVGYWGEGETVDPRDKDTLIRITSKWIVEIGELGSTMRKDVDILKAFLTRGTDDCRPPYGKKSMEYPRKTVFVATVNETEFLLDATGNRRWAVVPLDANLRIDYATQIKTFDTMQFWAEIYHYMQAIIENGGTMDGCFRFTEQERQCIEQRNSAHIKPMKGEIEVLDVLTKNTVVDETRYTVEWREVSVTQWKEDNIELMKYSSAEIAKVLKKLGYESRIVRKGNSTVKVQTLPYRVCLATSKR